MVETTTTTTTAAPVPRTLETTDYMQTIAGIFFKVFGAIGAVIVITVVIIIIRKYQCIRRKKPHTRRTSKAETELTEVAAGETGTVPQQESCPPPGGPGERQYITAILDGVIFKRQESNNDVTESTQKSPKGIKPTTFPPPTKCKTVYAPPITNMQDAQSSCLSECSYVDARFPVSGSKDATYNNAVGRPCDVIVPGDHIDDNVNSMSVSGVYEKPDVVDININGHGVRPRLPTPPILATSHA